ncbi:ferredoxin [Streptomyces sp. H27-D2]|uniref:ferredoxin n=1 Tax=Streptomyces sp. H27-D2 TaxID=3046304 RepID=UPI002DB57F55|nr:ferredoxin [Streptomyces sp. H27-D2]MEC4016771.1 ferredoxin [Streptomyces sp. H27-D2]
MNPLLPAYAFGPPSLLAGLEDRDRLDHGRHNAVHGVMPSLQVGEILAISRSIDLRERDHDAQRFADELQSVLDSAAEAGHTAVAVHTGLDELSAAKDRMLMQRTPHLVLDGALLVARAIGAKRVDVFTDSGQARASLHAAIAERQPLGNELSLSVSASGPTGRGSGAGGGDGRPTREPTLCTNTETLAQLAVAVRLGPCVYGATGMASEPGTMLLAFADKWIVETPSGVPLSYLLEFCALGAGQGVLVGGYRGGWLSPRAAAETVASHDSVQEHGGELGDGTILPLPEATCPLGELSRVAGRLAELPENRCGGCARELAAVTRALHRLVTDGGQGPLDVVNSGLAALDGPTICQHARQARKFIGTALTVFSADLAAHLQGVGCGRPVIGHLPIAPSESQRPGRLRVDRTRCVGTGLCASALPEAITLAADGYPARFPVDVPPRSRGNAVSAVNQCPARALQLEVLKGGSYVSAWPDEE